MCDVNVQFENNVKRWFQAVQVMYVHIYFYTATTNFSKKQHDIRVSSGCEEIFHTPNLNYYRKVLAPFYPDPVHYSGPQEVFWMDMYN